ncbi:MAG: DUF3450 domain-containing protein [Gammaproteobacteria bacterium]
MPRSVITGIAALVSGLVVAVVPFTAWAQQQTLDRSVNTQNEIVKKAAATQKQIDGLSTQTQKLLNQYLVAEQQIDQLQKYDANLQGLINNQQSNITSLNQQLAHISDVEVGIVPLMEKMISGLKNFIQLDLPFNRKSRMQAVQKLQDLMTNSDVTISEKYRQIMAAYQNELDFGRTLDAYRGPITINGKQQTVQFLRVGRVSLCYQTLNASRTACWNKAKHQWVVNGGFRRNVSTGLSIARKQGSPNLVILPVLAPQPPLQNTSLPVIQTAPAVQSAPSMQTQKQAAPATKTSSAAKSHP